MKNQERKKTILIRSMEEKKRTFHGVLFALPWIIGFLFFQLYPLLSSAFYGFTEFNAVKNPVWVGWDNYVGLFSDKLFYMSMGNTLVYTAISTPLFIGFALVLALMIKNKLFGRTVFRTIFFMPTIIPMVAAAMVWVRLFDPANGLINRILGILGLGQPLWLNDQAYAKLAIIIICAWGLGTTMIILLAALQEVPESYYEAARIDGANAIQRFFFITIPCIAHVLIYQIVLCIIAAFQLFTQSYVVATLAAGWGTSTRNPGGPQNSLLFYSIYLYQNAFKYLKMGKASAMGWILFVLIAVIAFIVLRSTRRFMDNGVGGE